MLTNFQFTVNQWWKFQGDRKRIKSLLSRLKDIIMASKNLYRENLNLIAEFPRQARVAEHHG